MIHPTIRPLRPTDGAAAAHIFFDAIHNGTTSVYTPAQRAAWAGTAPRPAAWVQKFRTITGYAATVDDRLVGFMTLDNTGYIDLAFVRADMAGQGISRLLYMHIQAQAARRAITTLTTEASLQAHPFFIRMGWQVDMPQTVEKSGVALSNVKMSKHL